MSSGVQPGKARRWTSRLGRSVCAFAASGATYPPTIGRTRLMPSWTTRNFTSLLMLRPCGPSRGGRVKGHLRTRAEGTAEQCKKPNPRKNRVNPGGSVTVCAGIIDGRLRLWRHLDKGKWNGLVAANIYRGPLLKALQKYRGMKANMWCWRTTTQSGFKSGKGLNAKKEVASGLSHFRNIHLI